MCTFCAFQVRDPRVKSGLRRNAEIAIHIDLKRAIQDGYRFWRSDNDVIVTEQTVPPEYTIKIEDIRGWRPVSAPYTPERIRHQGDAAAAVAGSPGVEGSGSAGGGNGPPASESSQGQPEDKRRNISSSSSI